MADENVNVNINTWPEKPAILSHLFESEIACPVSIGFGETSAHVRLDSSEEDPIHMDMDMNLTADKPVQLAVAIKDRLCAVSEYVINITVFERPVASISLRGKTILFNQQEE
ncbi:MAG: hypothetical protein GY854_34315 [Deltaproteobacteria bacterium]|nr:hypothetical protein [Deltaproteobacteria bacterium]